MKDIKLFRLAYKTVQHIKAKDIGSEKDLEELCKSFLEDFFGVYFLANQYYTTDNKIIDTIGIDFDGCPVIFEYKKKSDTAVIHQSMQYLEWLKDRKAEFRELVRGHFKANQLSINFDHPRIICVAQKFNDKDIAYVKNSTANIELIHYQMFDNEIIAFQRVHVRDLVPKSTKIRSIFSKLSRKQSSEKQSNVNISINSSDNVFYYQSKQTGIAAKGIFKDNKFILLKGAKFRVETSTSLTTYTPKKALHREQLISKHPHYWENGILMVVLEHDEICKDFMEADILVVGRRDNSNYAKKRWVTEKGQSMFDIENSN